MNINIPKLIDQYLHHPDPSIRYQTHTRLLGESPDSIELRKLRNVIKTSPRVLTLLSERIRDGSIPYNAYGKWYGAHWVLVQLADLDYPPDDESLRPLCKQVLDTWLDKFYLNQVPLIEGRYRRCASQQGNALYAMCKLELDDDRCEQLVELLLKWQWQDGGWNCDKKPEAGISSFTETLIPLRGLIWYQKRRGKIDVSQAIRQAAEIFLQRELFKRKRDGKIVDRNFVELHYPRYWHYDILFALTVLNEGGLLDDPRCKAALDLLLSKQLPDGSFPAEKKYFFSIEKFYPNGSRATGYSLESWEPQGKRMGNPYLTIDALQCLLGTNRIAH